jgi:hypothetical protein
MLNFLYRILAAILKMADISKFWKYRIAPLMVTYHYVKFYVSIIIHLEVININDSWHQQISTGRHFQNGHHNTSQIQHCSISTKFHMWVDYDVLNWFPTSQNFYLSPFSKWPPQYRKKSSSEFVKIFQCRESIRDIIMYPHIKFWWYRTMLNFYRPFFMPCFGSHFENGRHLENLENAEIFDRSPLEEQFCVFKIFKITAIFIYR